MNSDAWDEFGQTGRGRLGKWESKERVDENSTANSRLVRSVEWLCLVDSCGKQFSSVHSINIKVLFIEMFNRKCPSPELNNKTH